MVRLPLYFFDDGWAVYCRFKRTGKRSEIFLASKFGFKPDLSVDGSAENAKASVESSLKRLGVDYIDLYYLHR